MKIKPQSEDWILTPCEESMENVLEHALVENFSLNIFTDSGVGSNPVANSPDVKSRKAPKTHCGQVVLLTVEEQAQSYEMTGPRSWRLIL